VVLGLRRKLSELGLVYDSDVGGNRQCRQRSDCNKRRDSESAEFVA